jgi:hypothetical protein
MSLMSLGFRNAERNMGYLGELVEEHAVQIALLNEASIYPLRAVNDAAVKDRNPPPFVFSEEGTRGRDGTVALATGVGIRKTRAMSTRRHPPIRPAPRSAFSGYRFPPEVITLAVRRYLRFGLSYRDVEELLAERGIEVDHVSIFRWVQRFAPEFAQAARGSPAPGR